MAREHKQPLTPDQPRDPRDERLVGGVLGSGAREDMEELVGKSATQELEQPLPNIEIQETKKDEVRRVLIRLCEEMSRIKKSIKEKQTESRTRHATEIQELTDRKDEVEEELRAYLIGNFRGDRFVYIYDKNEGPPPFPTSFEKKLKVLLHDNLDFPKFREGADMRASGEEGGELLIEDESGGLSPVSGNYEVIDFRHDMQNLAFFFLQNEKFFDLYFKDK